MVWETAELTRIYNELMRLGMDWTERCDRKRASSCKNYSQSINTLTKNDLCVVFFMSVFVLWQQRLGSLGLRAI